MISDEMRTRVRQLRDVEGLSWPQISRKVGRPVRTCQRAYREPDRPCAHKDCSETAMQSGRFCWQHARLRMRNKPGSGVRQQQVMRLMRRHGHMTPAQLANLTGMEQSALGHVLSRLVQLGKIERPLPGHYTMPRPDVYKPTHPVPTPIERLSSDYR